MAQLLDKDQMVLSTGLPASEIPVPLWGVTLGDVFLALFTDVEPTDDMVSFYGQVAYPKSNPEVQTLREQWAREASWFRT